MREWNIIGVISFIANIGIVYLNIGGVGNAKSVECFIVNSSYDPIVFDKKDVAKEVYKLKYCQTCKGVVSPAFKITELNPWEVYEFPWGSAVKKRNSKWTHIFIGEQTLYVENMEVSLHDNGIEFVKK